MENKKIKSYKMTPTCHKVNIFHLETAYRFFNISCKNCFLHDKCESTKHKREICMVAVDAEKLLLKFTRGRVSCFESDDFYIKSNHKKRELLPIFRHLLKKYAVSRYAR